jgi:hypothetical protein
LEKSNNEAFIENQDCFCNLHIPIFGICTGGNIPNVQALKSPSGHGKLDTLDSFYNGWTYLVEDSASTVGALHSRESLQTFWCDLFVTGMTDVNH